MQDVGAKVRIRFVPSSRTREDIMMFSTLLNAEKKRIEERIAKRKADALKMMEIPTDTGMEVKKRANSTFTDEVDLTYIGSQEGTREGKEVESRNRTESYQSEVTFARSRKNTEITLNSVQESLECSEEPGDSVAGSLQDTKKNTKSNMKEDNMWDMVLGAERSWISHSVKLMPGEYFVFADVSYDLPYEEIFLRSIPADINESPWLDSESPLMDEYHPLNGNNNSILTFSSAADIAASHSNVLSSKKSMIDSKKSFIQPKEKVELKRSPRVWLQISSISKFEIESSTADSPLSIPPGLSTSVEHIEIQPETHPFVGESQSETASRELFELLTKYKGEMAAVGAEYMYLNNSYQEYQQRINELAKLG